MFMKITSKKDKKEHLIAVDMIVGITINKKNETVISTRDRKTIEIMESYGNIYERLNTLGKVFESTIEDDPPAYALLRSYIGLMNESNKEEKNNNFETAKMLKFAAHDALKRREEYIQEKTKARVASDNRGMDSFARGLETTHDLRV